MFDPCVRVQPSIDQPDAQVKIGTDTLQTE